jgi:serine/threonine protein kinase
MMRRKGALHGSFQPAETKSSFSPATPSRRTKGRPWLRKVGWTVGLIGVVALAFWYFVLKQEYYCFVWESWRYPSLNDPTQCKKIERLVSKQQHITSSFGFRAVWKAWMTDEDNPQGKEGKAVCLKQLKDANCCGDVKAHFREVVIESQLHHPSIVPFITACNRGPKFSIISEFMEGGPIVQGISRSFSGAQVISLALDIARGLQYLHYECPLATLIHDDLNPQQILMNKQRTRAFITDFNLSNHITRGSKYGVRRYWWPKGGSWKFFAPEKLRLEYYTEAVDIWSFGVIFYQMVMQANGFPDEWSQTVTREFYEKRILNSETDGWRPNRPNFQSPDKLIYENVWPLIEDCWQYHPHLRPNATALVHRLQKLLP